MKFIFVPLVCLFFNLTANSQTVENITINTEGDKTFIRYDLLGAKENQQVDVKIVANIKGLIKPVYKISGDYGSNVVPGPGRVIIWRNNEELTSYNLEDISFTISISTKQYHRAVKK